jgi:hypothetical protein
MQDPQVVHLQVVRLMHASQLVICHGLSRRCGWSVLLGDAVVSVDAAKARKESSSPSMSERFVVNCTCLPCGLDDACISPRSMVGLWVSKVGPFARYNAVFLYRCIEPVQSFDIISSPGFSRSR